MTKTWRWTLFAAGAALVALQLFVPPVLGVADDCDFGRLRAKACIVNEVPDKYPYFDYFVPGYAINPQECWSDMPTSAAIPVKVSVWPARLLLPKGHYDLRFLGALYGCMFLGAFWYFCRNAGPAAGAAVLVVFFSAVYVPLFNTFYMDAAAFVWLIWAVVLSIRMLTADEVRWHTYLALAGFLVLLATSKMQYALLPLCLIPVLWLRFGRRGFPAIWLRTAATAAVLAALGVYMSAMSPWYGAIALYNGLFFKFLPACQNPRAELRTLGLGPEFDEHVGQHSYYPATHMQEREYALAFARILTVPKMAGFVLTHPRADAIKLKHDLEEASLERVRMKLGDREYRLGNYETKTGHAPEAQSHFFAAWSAIKLALVARRPWIYLVYILSLVAGLWIAALRQRTLRAQAVAGVGILTALLVGSFLPAFLDGLDTGRHLMFFNCFLDMGVCGLLALVSGWWRGRAGARPPCCD